MLKVDKRGFIITFMLIDILFATHHLFEKRYIDFVITIIYWVIAFVAWKTFWEE